MSERDLRLPMGGAAPPVPPGSLNERPPTGTGQGTRQGASPDIRGWDVLTAEGTLVGVVDDLLLSASSRDLAALVVLAHGDLVLVPITSTRPDLAARRVLTDLSYAQFAALARSAVQRRPASVAPPATGGQGGQTGVTIERTADGEEIIRIPIVEEELVVQRRPVVREVVVVRKRVVIEERVIEADLRRERVDVDDRDGRHEEPRDSGR